MEQRKERPILFSGAMVRAILDGRKTQTRRVAKGVITVHAVTGEALRKLDSAGPREKCPYGEVGDLLWVRESGWERPERTWEMMRDGADTWAPYYFDADGYSEQDKADFKAWGFKRRPSIHMPRAASRITLEITGVRIEKLNDCSERDARAEGATCIDEVTGRQVVFPNQCNAGSYRLGYQYLWDTINGAGSWSANPWVWVVEFKRL